MFSLMRVPTCSRTTAWFLVVGVGACAAVGSAMASVRAANSRRCGWRIGVFPRNWSTELSAGIAAGVGRKSCQPDEHVVLGNPSPVGQQLAQLALFRVVESTVDHLGL